MAAPHAVVIVMMILGLGAVVIVVAMTVPVVVLMAVTLVCRIKTVFTTPPGHKHLEALWTVGGGYGPC